jgi:hypothetical protein
MLKAKPADQETNIIIDETAQQIITAFDHNRMDLIDDWEVDQLLDWTNGLNFTELVMIFLIFI